MRNLGAIALAFLLFGCATAYQSKGLTGGFSDTQLGPDVYRVSFEGNGYTGADRTVDFALLHAADLAASQGYEYFVVLESKDQTTEGSYYVPKQSYTTGNATANIYGNTAYVTGSSTTTTTGGYAMPVIRPGVGMVVKFLHDRPEEGMVFTVAYIQQSVRAKYKIKP